MIPLSEPLMGENYLVTYILAGICTMRPEISN